MLIRVILFYFFYSVKIEAADECKDLNKTGPDVVNKCEIKEHAHMVSIHSKNSNKHLCSGSLITFNWILTSAICCSKMGKDGFVVYVGRSVLTDLVHGVEILSKFPHPSFSNDGEYNICLLRTKTPILQGRSVEYAKFVYAKHDKAKAACSKGTFPHYMCDVLVCDTLTTSDCFIDQVCGISPRVKQVDIGAPFMCTNYMFGILGQGVGTDENPLKFTVISEYGQFIYDTIASKSESANLCKMLIGLLLFQYFLKI